MLNLSVSTIVVNMSQPVCLISTVLGINSLISVDMPLSNAQIYKPGGPSVSIGVK